VKRLIAALCILGVLLGLSVYSQHLLRAAAADMTERADRVEALARQPAPSRQQLREECDAMCRQWAACQRGLNGFTRQEQLSAIAAELAPLPVLADFARYGEVAAGARRVRVLLDDLLELARPANVF